MNLEELKLEVSACQKCDLAKTRTQAVFGSGRPDADLVFIGEAPGYYEDLKGLPFVGAAGKLLERLLETIELTRENVFIANVLKCRPPGNRNPNPDEIDLCKPYLLKQLELIRPKIICTLGNFATRLVLETNVSISRVHGEEFNKQGYLIMPTFHPAAALHQRANLMPLRGDFVKLGEILSRDEAPAEEPSGETALEQLGLF